MDWYRLLPRYWFQDAPTSLEWDAALNEAIEAGDLEVVDDYEAKVGPYSVWLGNYPYGYGNMYKGPGDLPKVATRKRLKKALLTAAIAKAKEGGVK
jgi:hypothetical protein